MSYNKFWDVSFWLRIHYCSELVTGWCWRLLPNGKVFWCRENCCVLPCAFLEIIFCLQIACLIHTYERTLIRCVDTCSICIDIYTSDQHDIVLYIRSYIIIICMSLLHGDSLTESIEPITHGKLLALLLDITGNSLPYF